MNDGGRLNLGPFVVLAVLMIAPALAALRLGDRHGFWLVAVWYPLCSALTWFLYYDDKRRARLGAWRAPESSLHLFGLVGGWPGAFLAQRQLRHKVSKLKFQVMFWAIVALHELVAIDYLIDWRMAAALQGR